MTTNKRPWYKWYPKDFVVDEKVQSLSPIAELIYRRALDVMWQANACRLPDVCYKLANALSRGLTDDQFKSAWDEIQYPGFELFNTTEDNKWIYSKRLLEQAEAIEKIVESRRIAGQKGGQANAKANAKQVLSKCYSFAKANAKQTCSDTDTDTDTDT